MTWLILIIAIPLVGAGIIAFLPLAAETAKRLAFAISLVPLGLGIGVAVGYEPGGGMQYDGSVEWIEAFGAHFALGVDGLGLVLMLLTLILTPVVILASWPDGSSNPTGPAPRWSERTFFSWILALEGLSLGVFLAIDLLLFYILFEATLIPVYFMVAGWGGADRARAAMKFLLYSLAGGLILLAAVIGVYAESGGANGSGTYLMSELAEVSFDGNVGRWLFLGFFIAFAIKAPMFPVHTWLPDTVGNASPGTSVLLVSVLDKIGTFGMVRFCLELFPEASVWATPTVVVLALVSILYGAFMAIGASNIPRLIAYTSVSHFGFIVLGIFVMNSQGLVGANLYMFNHGLSTAALFLLTGYLIRRGGSQDLFAYGGVDKVAPILAGLTLLAGLSSLSLPGLSPFVSEFLVIVGAFSYHWVVAAIAVPAIVLAAIYILRMYQRTMTGPATESVSAMPELNLREIAAIAPVVVLIVGLGFYPKPLLEVLEPAVEHTMTVVDKADPEPTVGPIEPGVQPGSDEHAEGGEH